MMRTLIAVSFVLGLLLLFGTARAESEPRTLRVYHVGNSVTDTIRYAGLEAMAKGRGHTHVWGRHMIPGAPLQWIWDHPESGFEQPPYGYYPKALTEFQWDALTLQPFDRHIEGDEGDLAMAGNYIDMALTRSPDLDVYVYSRWPRRDEDKERSTDEAKVYRPLDFAAKWTREYTGGWDGTNETRDYFEQLTTALRERYPDLSIHIIPVGDVLLELDERMEAGQVPGFDDVELLYADGIHFNDTGAFVVATTFFATLYGDDPTGMDLPEQYGQIGPVTVQAIQQTVWDVVSKHERAGVGVGE